MSIDKFLCIFKYVRLKCFVCFLYKVVNVNKEILIFVYDICYWYVVVKLLNLFVNLFFCIVICSNVIYWNIL